jgi:hypothetical protein
MSLKFHSVHYWHDKSSCDYERDYHGRSPGTRIIVPVFLATFILFFAIENTFHFQTLRHLQKLNYPVCISLPFLGEFISEVGAVRGKDPIMRRFFNLIDTC